MWFEDAECSVFLSEWISLFFLFYCAFVASITQIQREFLLFYWEENFSEFTPVKLISPVDILPCLFIWTSPSPPSSWKALHLDGRGKAPFGRLVFFFKLKYFKNKVFKCLVNKYYSFSPFLVLKKEGQTYFIQYFKTTLVLENNLVLKPHYLFDPNTLLKYLIHQYFKNRSILYIFQ